MKPLLDLSLCSLYRHCRILLLLCVFVYYATYRQYVFHLCLCLAGREHILGIHREAPSFIEQGTEQEILETGIKVIRLLKFLSFRMNVLADNAQQLCLSECFLG